MRKHKTRGSLAPAAPGPPRLSTAPCPSGPGARPPRRPRCFSCRVSRERPAASSVGGAAAESSGARLSAPRGRTREPELERPHGPETGLRRAFRVDLAGPVPSVHCHFLGEVTSLTENASSFLPPRRPTTVHSCAVPVTVGDRSHGRPRGVDSRRQSQPPKPAAEHRCQHHITPLPWEGTEWALPWRPFSELEGPTGVSLWACQPQTEVACSGRCSHTYEHLGGACASPPTRQTVFLVVNLLAPKSLPI